FQEKGRGQNGRTWESSNTQNALFSLYLRPAFLSKNHLQTISFAIGLGVRAAVQQYLPQAEVKLKWPNDVLADGKKISGVLIENSLGQDIRSIVGVGLNVNQTEFVSNNKATSLSLELKSTVDVKEVIELCCSFIEKYYLLAKQSNGVQQIHKLYVSQLYKLDEDVMVNEQKWKVKGVDISGKLEVENNGITAKLIHNETEVQWS
ncbi:MAG: biotin--[acetyl-CoA-carboxylase] ligase, partial [Bacteroidia bacterium]|nr:biotin--[acetyl-CoA-carboxylase] ligase [Bacteroidia bacterium]